ncbi:single-strand DNA endonuclease ASTE1-like [Amphiura filiformis]|uniref:single-strand DNA endonuclease ASTE1-like n=1 Tax=Amphiura filiformis TaxID=82378 RepID=UPI003B211880
MGVKGLTSFIEQQHSLLLEYQLHDARVIIDGYGCMFYLYSAHLDHGHHGGEYDAYEDKCRLFFTNLHKCNITPYVVFDGAYDLDDKKLSTLRSRCEDRIKFAGNIADGRSGYLLPVLCEHVLKKVMNDLSVPSVVCDFEADHEIAALANAWNCPVLGRDSDFFVMDITGGYLPLEMLDWNHVRKKSAKSKADDRTAIFTAAKYTLTKFCKRFNVKKELIPLLATITGNDYVDPVCINQFLMKVYQRPKTGLNTAKKHGHLNSVLDWLSEQDTMEDCIEEILRVVKMDQRRKSTKVKRSIWSGCRRGCGSVPACFHLVIFVVIYWLGHADPKANVCHVKALLLCWMRCLVKQKHRHMCRDTLQWDDAEAQALMNNFHVNVEQKMKSYALDIEASHGYAQMQSCLKAAMHLNAALQHPFPEPDVALIYNGRLVHCLYATLKGIPGVIVSIRLGSNTISSTELLGHLLYIMH